MKVKASSCPERCRLWAANDLLFSIWREIKALSALGSVGKQNGEGSWNQKTWFPGLALPLTGGAQWTHSFLTCEMGLGNW